MAAPVACTVREQMQGWQDAQCLADRQATRCLSLNGCDDDKHGPWQRGWAPIRQCKPPITVSNLAQPTCMGRGAGRVSWYVPQDHRLLSHVCTHDTHCLWTPTGATRFQITRLPQPFNDCTDKQHCRLTRTQYPDHGVVTHCLFDAGWQELAPIDKNAYWINWHRKVRPAKRPA